MIKCFRFVDAFVLVNQHGRRNVNCKPAVGNLRYGKTIWQNCCKMSCMALLLVSITPTQTRLATNQAVAGCQTFVQKLENSSTFCNKSVHVARFTGPRQTCFAASDVNPVHGSRVILSNQTSVFKQLAATFICCNTGLNVGGKTRIIAVNTFCGNVAKQVARFCCRFTVASSKDVFERHIDRKCMSLCLF